MGLPNDTMVGDVSAPFSFDGEFRRLWLIWRRNTPGSYLQVVGFFQYIDISGTDPSQWKTLKVRPSNKWNSTWLLTNVNRSCTITKYSIAQSRSWPHSTTERLKVSPLHLTNLPIFPGVQENV
jgi:primary-amine oxidase